MKKATLIICSIAVVLVVLISFRICTSSLEYKIMNNTEALKSQLQEEYHVQSKQLFESVRVERKWWSLSPEDWTYIVVFSENPTEECVYKKEMERFIEIEK